VRTLELVTSTKGARLRQRTRRPPQPTGMFSRLRTRFTRPLQRGEQR
jgi:hypothetical protein